MRWVYFFLFFVQVLFAVDFDCVFIGTSPIPLFEALYQSFSGKSVLILEQDAICGGAWRSIHVCGVDHVDLGCHQIGYSPQLKGFLETYAGCNIVPMDNPKDPSHSFTSKGLYFSQGCHELIHNLLRLIAKTNIMLLLNHRCDAVAIDLAQKQAVVKTGKKKFTTKEIYYTAMTSFGIENADPSVKSSSRKPKYHHLYLLLQDPSPPRFSYQGYSALGASRIMNLTYFLGLEKLGQQMVVFQVNSEEALQKGQALLDDLKKKNLINPSAYILRQESYAYETACAPQRIPSEWSSYFKNLQTSGFISMTHHIPRWETVLRPFREIFPN